MMTACGTSDLKPQPSALQPQRYRVEADISNHARLALKGPFANNGKLSPWGQAESPSVPARAQGRFPLHAGTSRRGHRFSGGYDQALLVTGLL